MKSMIRNYSAAFIIVAMVLFVVVLITWNYEKELTNVKVYSIAMKVTDKRTREFENANVLSLEGEGEKTQLQVSLSAYDKYEINDLVEVEVTIKETSITHTELKFYRILGYYKIS